MLFELPVDFMRRAIPKSKTKQKIKTNCEIQWQWSPELILVFSCHSQGQKRPLPTKGYAPSSSYKVVIIQCYVPMQLMKLLQRKGGLGIQSDISRQNKMTEGNRILLSYWIRITLWHMVAAHEMLYPLGMDPGYTSGKGESVFSYWALLCIRKREAG